MGSEKRIVTQDVREIPPHCVPLSSFGGRRNKRGGSWEYETLHSLCKRREIKHWKFERGRTGQLFVEPDTARTMLDAMRHQRGEVTQATTPRVQVGIAQVEAAVVAMCEINNGITLMQATLERLTLAVESIATQPKTAHDRLLATVDGNGFHN